MTTHLIKILRKGWGRDTDGFYYVERSESEGESMDLFKEFIKIIAGRNTMKNGLSDSQIEECLGKSLKGFSYERFNENSQKQIDINFGKVDDIENFPEEDTGEFNMDLPDIVSLRVEKFEPLYGFASSSFINSKIYSFYNSHLNFSYYERSRWGTSGYSYFCLGEKGKISIFKYKGGNKYYGYEKESESHFSPLLLNLGLMQEYKVILDPFKNPFE